MVIVNDIKTIIEESNKIIVRNVNTIMLQTYWNLGRRIVEEQKGSERVEYGTALLKGLSKELTKNMVSFFQSQIYFHEEVLFRISKILNTVWKFKVVTLSFTFWRIRP